jgi:alpha-L-fucosidase 2
MRWILLLTLMPLLAVEQNNVEYARPGGTPLLLDLSVPESAGLQGAVVVVHGGGWVRGDKRSFVGPILQTLTEARIAWFSIDYRLAPQHRYPAALEDVEEAVRWVQKNAARYRIDPRRIVLLGESAGGHLVALAAARGRLQLAGAVPFYGITDFDSRIQQWGPAGLSDNTKSFFGIQNVTPETLRQLREASATSYVKKGMPPFLLIHGTKDETVPYPQSTVLYEKMRQAGASCELFTVTGGGHGVTGWEKDPQHQAYKPRLVAWIRAAFQRAS